MLGKEKSKNLLRMSSLLCRGYFWLDLEISKRALSGTLYGIWVGVADQSWGWRSFWLGSACIRPKVEEITDYIYGNNLLVAI